MSQIVQDNSVASVPTSTGATTPRSSRSAPPVSFYRTYVILRHTFTESIVQPIYPLLLALGSAVLVIFSVLPFFTLSEDSVMYKVVTLDFVLLFVLITTLFATSKSIFDEIEDRTMLTLMSKPVQRWEVLLGKYLGIILSSLLAVALLGLVLGLCMWWRIPGDYLINANSLDDLELKRLHGLRLMHLAGLAPALVLLWLQISVLAAVGVALSTRVSLVVNLPVVIFLYMAGNLTRFLFPSTAQQSALTKATAWTLATVLPYLENFDLRQKTVYEKIKVAQFINDQHAIALSSIWGYVGWALLYAAMYTFFALTAGMWLFQTRELGGAEG